jgi:hypothetical protein
MGSVTQLAAKAEDLGDIVRQEQPFPCTGWHRLQNIAGGASVQSARTAWFRLQQRRSEGEQSVK